MNRQVILGVALIGILTSGCATERPQGLALAADSAPAADVTGTWSGTVGQGGGNATGDIVYTLQQDGSKVTGNARLPGWSGLLDVVGTVVGDKFTYGGTRGGCCAELTIKGDEMIGRGINGAPIQIRRMK